MKKVYDSTFQIYQESENIYKLYVFRYDRVFCEKFFKNYEQTEEFNFNITDICIKHSSIFIDDEAIKKYKQYFSNVKSIEIEETYICGDIFDLFTSPERLGSSEQNQDSEENHTSISITNINGDQYINFEKLPLLTNLKTLYLNGLNIINFEKIQQLKNLEKLVLVKIKLQGDKISNIGLYISKLNNLRQLTLRDIDLYKIKRFNKYLKKLEKLLVLIIMLYHSFHIKYFNIRFLAYLPNINLIHFDSISIKSYKPFKNVLNNSTIPTNTKIILWQKEFSLSLLCKDISIIAKIVNNNIYYNSQAITLFRRNKFLYHISRLIKN